MSYTAPLRARAHRLLLILVLAVSACSPPTHREPAPLVVEALVDVSGSYERRPAAITTLERLVDQLRPGDRLVIRSLAEASHREGGILLDERIPSVAPAGSRFDPMAQAAHTESIARADSVKAWVKSQIRELREQPPASRTDIVGGIAIAAENLQYHPSEAARAILLFTDGIDTGNNQDSRLPLDLSRVRVVFLHFDPAGTFEARRGLQDRWTEQISGDWAAAELLFVPGASEYDLALLRVPLETAGEGVG